MKRKIIKFKEVINKYNGRDFLICCPGKNILEYISLVQSFAISNNLLTIGSNKICEIIDLDFHLFTNNDKYETYGSVVNKKSQLMLGGHILSDHIMKHRPSEYVVIQYTDRDENEPISYDVNKDVIHGYYRTSGNLAIMMCHLMGARNIYIAGMSGFTYEFDGAVHYYKAEIKRDKKTYKEWLRRYDRPVERSLDNLKSHGINFKIITPTIYSKHFDGKILR